MTTLCGSGPSPDSRRSLQRAWSGPQRWELAEREWTVANTTRREKLDLVVGHRAARIKEASEEKAPKPDGEPLAKKHSRAQAFRAKVKEEDRAHYQEKSQILAQLCEARCDPPSWRLPACLPACWRLGRTGCTANMTEQKINVELTSRIGPDGLVHHVVSSMAGPPPKKQRNSDGREPEPRGPSDPPSEISSATWRARKKQLVKEAEALQEAGDISQMDLTLIRQIVPSDPETVLRRYWASRDAAKRTSTGIAQLLGRQAGRSLPTGPLAGGSRGGSQAAGRSQAAEARNMTEQKINVELTLHIDPDGRVHHVVSSMAGPPPKKPRNSGDGREPELYTWSQRVPPAPSDINSATWRARKKQLVKEAEALQEAGDISQMDLTLIRQIVPSDPETVLRRYWASRDAAKRTSTGIAQLLDSVRRTAPATVAVNWCGGGGGGARALATGGRGEQQHGGDAVAGGQHGVAAATTQVVVRL